MGKFILFLDRVINLYLYYVVMACFLSLVPNINPDYPLFHYIFKCAGFYLIPPILGFVISPLFIMVTVVLISRTLKTLYIKYFLKKDASQIVFITKDEFEKKLNEELLKHKENEENNGD